MMSQSDERVVAYIDGFNLYFGLRSKGWRRYYWLDVPKLVSNLLVLQQTLTQVHYFTARVSSPSGKQKRQNSYLEALSTLRGCQLHFGQHANQTFTCRRCGHKNLTPSEKMTDVNISVEMLADAYHDRFDTALLISADSDLVPPVRKMLGAFPRKRVVVAFPPGRASKHLAQAATASLHIGRGRLAQSLLPETITKPDGYVIRAPQGWLPTKQS